MLHRNGMSARSIIPHFDANQGNGFWIPRHFQLQSFPVQVALVMRLRPQIKYGGMGQLLAGKTLVDFMEDGAGEQQVLKYDCLLGPCFKENMFSCFPRAGENKMRKRKYSSQTIFHVHWLLKLGLQMLHLCFY